MVGLSHFHIEVPATPRWQPIVIHTMLGDKLSTNIDKAQNWWDKLSHSISSWAGQTAQ